MKLKFITALIVGIMSSSWAMSYDDIPTKEEQCQQSDFYQTAEGEWIACDDEDINDDGYVDESESIYEDSEEEYVHDDA